MEFENPLQPGALLFLEDTVLRATQKWHDQLAAARLNPDALCVSAYAILLLGDDDDGAYARMELARRLPGYNGGDDDVATEGVAAKRFLAALIASRVEEEVAKRALAYLRAKLLNREKENGKKLSSTS